MKIKWDVSELMEFADHLEWFENFENDMLNAAKELAIALRMAIRNHTPVVTGKLKRGWKANYIATITDKGVRVEFVNDVDYARAVNYGHRSHNQYNKGGTPYTVKNRTVALDSRWGQTSTEYYVYGHFFLEKGVLETEAKAEAVIFKHLKRWWKWCVNG